MISSEPDYLPKALYLNIITLGCRVSMYEFGEILIQHMHSTHITSFDP